VAMERGGVVRAAATPDGGLALVLVAAPPQSKLGLGVVGDFSPPAVEEVGGRWCGAVAGGWWVGRGWTTWTEEPEDDEGGKVGGDGRAWRRTEGSRDPLIRDGSH
jgi:hypothetical protein